MHKLLEKVEKELNNIADKGITGSNVEMTYKLMDIYKDIKESEYYEANSSKETFDARMRDSRGRYMENYNRYDPSGRDEYRYDRGYDSRNRNNYYMTLDEKSERYMNRMRDGMENYMSGRERYRNGDDAGRMADGLDMVMSAVCMFVEHLYDFAETSAEKEMIRKHLDKMKKL